MKLLIGGALATFATAAMANSLYNNGPFVTGTGNGFSGANTSAWTVFNTPQGPIASNIGCNHGFFRVMEPFSVPMGQQWQLQEFASYAFRTTTSSVFPPVSSFVSMHIAIYNADPRTGALPIAGNFTTNRYTGSNWTGTYRVSPTLLTDRTRPIMEVRGDLAWAPTLSSGQYWVEFGLQSTSASSAVFAVGVSPVPANGMARQRQVSNNQIFEWSPVTTAFEIRGTVVPEPMSLSALALGALGVMRRRRVA